MWTVIIVSFFQHFILFHRFWLRPKLSNVFQINYNLWNSVLSDLLVIYNVKMWQMCHFFLRHVKTGVVLFCYQRKSFRGHRFWWVIFFFQNSVRVGVIIRNICQVMRSVVPGKNMVCQTCCEHYLIKSSKKKNFFFSKFQKNWSFFAKFGTRINWFIITSQLTFSCSGSRIETFEKGVKYVQS